MKDLGTICYFLDIEVAYSPIGCLLSQSQYIANIFEQAHISDTILANSLFELNVKYSPSDGVPLSYSILYRTLVCNFVHLNITILDISYAGHVSISLLFLLL